MVFNPEGVLTARLNAPWVYDARGTSLPTHFTVTGNRVTQHVDTAAARFPVTADPHHTWGWDASVTIYFNKRETLQASYVPGLIAPFSCPSGWSSSRLGSSVPSRDMRPQRISAFLQRCDLSEAPTPGTSPAARAVGTADDHDYVVVRRPRGERPGRLGRRRSPFWLEPAADGPLEGPHGPARRCPRRGPGGPGLPIDSKFFFVLIGVTLGTACFGAVTDGVTAYRRRRGPGSPPLNPTKS